MSADRASLKFPASTSKIDFSKKPDRSVLKDQSILITGGANGIGLGYAEACAEAGAYVTILDLVDETGQATAQRLTEKGGKVQFIQGDVRIWDDQVRAFEAATANSPCKSLDIVLAVAGVVGASIEKWLANSSSSDGKPIPPDPKVIDINLTAMWYTAHLALYYFRQSFKTESRASKSKQVVFVSSMAGYSSSETITDYVGSKWGVRGVWRSLRTQKNILGADAGSIFRTSLIAPWWIKTNMTAFMEPHMEPLGLKFASMDYVVQGLMAIICNEEVQGRAVCIAPQGPFDLCDDFEGLDAGREWPERLARGEFGTTYEQLGQAFSNRNAPR